MPRRDARAPAARRRCPPGTATALFLYGRAVGEPARDQRRRRAPSRPRGCRGRPRRRAGWWAVRAGAADDRGGRRSAASRRSRASRPDRRWQPPSARPPGRRGADRGLHGDVRARPGAVRARRSSRCGRRPTSDWVCVDQRRRVGARALRARSRERARRRRALRALARRRSGSASTATSSARCALAPAEAGAGRAVRPGRPLAPGEARGLRAALGDATLVYSDQRLVDADGRVLRDTLWRGRRNNHDRPDLDARGQHVTGAAMLFRREVAELALPFPDTPGMAFHDHWLALVALAAGDVAYVDRPLYDYVQHRGAFFGAVTHGRAPPRPARGMRWRGRVLPRLPAARGARRRRCSPAAASGSRRRKRRALRRFVARRALAARRAPGSPRARCARWPAAPRRSAARASSPRGPACGAGSRRRRRPRRRRCPDAWTLRAAAPAPLAGARLSAAYASADARAPGGHRGPRRREDLPRSPTHRVDTLKERATAPVRARRRTASCAALRGRLLRRPPGRVLRDRRPQRLGQEHAAEDHVEHLPRRRAAAIRMAGRLAPFIELGVGFNPELTVARERRAQRRDDGPRPPRGARAGSTRCSTSPSCASSPTSSSRTTRRG